MSVQKIIIAFLKLDKAEQQRVKRSIDALLAEQGPDEITPPPTGTPPGGPPK